MAKVIRSCWVHKKYNRWWRYLPRRNDRPKEYDYVKYGAMPDDFNEPMDVDVPPKMWLVWMYRDIGHKAEFISRERYWIQERVRRLFGEIPEPGKMFVFKNTADLNDKLWHVKHLIELKPITFPNGEPTEADIPYMEVTPDGRCLIDREAFANPAEIQLADPKKQFSNSYLSSMLKSRDHGDKDVFPDTVYNPANITIVD